MDETKRITHHEFQAIEQSATLAFQTAAAVMDWLRDSADQFEPNDEGATASGHFDPAFLMGRVQRILRPHLAALLAEIEGR